jgi:DNA-binding beta-propeller fold protein YncE
MYMSLPSSWMRRATPLIGALALLTISATALAAPTRGGARQPVSALGSLAQLPGPSGCLVDGPKPRGGCRPVRALAGAAPILGSHAIAVSPDGKSVYVAASRSNAIAVFGRDPRTGTLTQRPGAAGCIAARGADGCAVAVGLLGPNSVTVSPDGRNVYATSLASNAVVILRRNPSTGSLTQLGAGTGCIANVPIPGCATGRAFAGPDVVAVSPDGSSVYVGAFTGSALAVFARNPSTGALTQPTDATGCVVNTPITGCTSALALASPEGIAVSGDGTSVYVAAPGSNAVDAFSRNTATGALSQPTDGSGCVSSTAFVGCTLGTQLGGADAVAVSPNDASVYVTSLTSNSVTAFSRSPTGQLAQLGGTSACVINTLAVGCSLARELGGAEGLAVSPDGANVYAVAYASSALDVLNRNAGSGAVTQKSRAPGCLVAGPPPGCLAGRALQGASSVAVSPDGRNVYTAAYSGNSVGVFKRVTAAMTHSHASLRREAGQ